MADSAAVEWTDAELIAAVLNGETASFEPLVKKYQPRVFATARRYARRESEVEDIVQEVFLKAFQKLRSFRGDAPFEHWLMRLAVRTCYDFLRAHRRNREAIGSNASAPIHPTPASMRRPRVNWSSACWPNSRRRRGSSSPCWRSRIAP